MSYIVTRASFFSVLLLASSVFALPSAARAQNLPEARTRSITPFLHTSIGMSDPAPGNSMGVVGAVTYDWATGLAVEGEVSHLFDLAGDTPAVDWSITNRSRHQPRRRSDPNAQR